MATTRINTATTLRFKVENGTTDTGNIRYATRSFGGINPELTDDDIYAVGQGLAAMQSHEVGDIQRLDTATLGLTE